MPAPSRVLFSVVTVFFTLSVLLAVLQPWYWAHLYIPIRDSNYFTIENRTESWSIRVGYVGGVHGLDIGLKQMDPEEQALRDKILPFPTTWIIDWSFHIKRTSPFFLLSTPLYFPSIVLGIWPACKVATRVSRWRNSLTRRHRLSNSLSKPDLPG